MSKRFANDHLEILVWNVTGHIGTDIQRLRLATEQLWRTPWRLSSGIWEIRDWKLPQSCLAETYSDGRQTKQHRSSCWMRSLRRDSTPWIRLTFIPNGCREIEAGSPRRSSANGWRGAGSGEGGSLRTKA